MLQYNPPPDNENGARLAEEEAGWDGKDETATGVSKYVQISQGGKFAATSIPWSLVTALQAVKTEGKRKPEVPGVKSLSLSDSQRLLFAFSPV